LAIVVAVDSSTGSDSRLLCRVPTGTVCPSIGFAHSISDSNCHHHQTMGFNTCGQAPQSLRLVGQGPIHTQECGLLQLGATQGARRTLRDLCQSLWFVGMTDWIDEMAAPTNVQAMPDLLVGQDGPINLGVVGRVEISRSK